MNEQKLIKRLKRNDEKALEDIIRKYTAYVSAVAANRLGGFGDISAIEELTSDVFFSLWKSRLTITAPDLKGWLGTVARNKAKNHIRAQRVIFEELKEDCLVCSDDNMFDRLEKDEKNKVISDALAEMNTADREILIRYYFYNQSVRRISEETQTNIETVKSRLGRSRKKLRHIFEKGGYFK